MTENILLQENVQECKKEKINHILHKCCNHLSVYDVKMFIMLTERTYCYKLELLWKIYVLSKMCFVQEFLNITFLLHTCSAEHYIL